MDGSDLHKWKFDCVQKGGNVNQEKFHNNICSQWLLQYIIMVHNGGSWMVWVKKTNFMVQLEISQIFHVTALQ